MKQIVLNWKMKYGNRILVRLLLTCMTGFVFVGCVAEEEVLPFDQAGHQVAGPSRDVTIERADNLYELAKANYRTNIENAHFYANELLILSENNDYKEGIANAHNALGIVYDSKKNYRKSLKHFLAATSLNEHLNHEPNLAKLYNNLAAIYQKNSSFEKAIDYYEKSIALKKKHHFSESKIATSIRNLGTVYYNQEQYDRALSQYQEALLYYQQDDNQDKIAKVLNNIGFTYAEKQQYVKAEEALRQSEAIRLASQDHVGLVATYLNLGAMYNETGKSQEALAYFFKTKEIQDQHQFTYKYGHTLLQIGMVYTQNEETQKALSYLKNAETILVKSPKPKDREELVRLYDLYAQNYSLLGNLQKVRYFDGIKRQTEISIQKAKEENLNISQEEIMLAEASFKEFKEEFLVSSFMRYCNNDVMSFLAIAFLLLSGVFGYSIMVLWRVN